MKSTEALDKEIVIERVFDARRDLVFKAWTDPDHLANWWGPVGASAVITEHNFTVGGHWRYDMGSPGGKGGGVTCEFLEIVPPEKVVTRDVMGDAPEGHPRPEDVTVTAIFEELGEKTKVTLRILHASVEDREKNEGIGIQFGWGSCLDSLDNYLAEMAEVANS